jgi:hypothetical protein
MVLYVVEVDEDNLIAARVIFDHEEVDAAFAELDARYLAGEAAANARTWTAVAGAYHGFNRRDLPATPDVVNIDHRRGPAFVEGDGITYTQAVGDVSPDIKTNIEAVHRLSHLGAVITSSSHGTSQEGFDAEWRSIDLLTVEGDRINRFELFDESDLSTALTAFDVLNRPALMLENAATRTRARLADAFNRRDLNAFLAVGAAHGLVDDRRKGLSAVFQGPEFRRAVHVMVESAPEGWQLKVEPVAVRGSRLALTRDTYRDTEDPERPIVVEHLTVIDVDNGDDGSWSVVAFDPDDINGAMAELTARWIASGEVAHPEVIRAQCRLSEATNRHDWDALHAGATFVDHRQLAAGGADTMADHMSSIRTMASLIPDLQIETAEILAHSASALMVHMVVKGTSTEGVAVELPLVVITVLDGDRMTHTESFDLAQRDSALARFEELNRPTLALENAAIRTQVRVAEAINRRDVEDLLGLHQAQARHDDWRTGLRNEGPVDRNFVQSVLEAPVSWRLDWEPVAIRGQRLGLTRNIMRDTNEPGHPIAVESLILLEVTDDQLIKYTAIFDPDDINGAIAELTARWIASGEVAHPEVIEAARQIVESSNRYEWDAVGARCADATYINHRLLGTPGTSADYMSSIQMLVSLVPNLQIEQAEILAHSAAGFATLLVLKGTSTEGVAMELPFIMIGLIDGDRLTHIETFDENERARAQARFDELNR